MTRRSIVRSCTALVIFGGTALVAGSTAFAAPDGPKVTICHRTASHDNPYVRITVARSSVDGNLGRNGGKGDHFMEHRGPVGPLESGEWGDIIPPIPGVHGGLNWDATGIAVFDNDCSAVTVTTASGATTTTAPPEPTTTTTTTTTTDVTYVT